MTAHLAGRHAATFTVRRLISWLLDSIGSWLFDDIEPGRHEDHGRPAFGADAEFAEMLKGWNTEAPTELLRVLEAVELIAPYDAPYRNAPAIEYLAVECGVIVPRTVEPLDAMGVAFLAGGPR